MDDDDELAPPDGMVLGRVVITRVMTEDNVLDHVIAVDGEDGEMPLAEALGMMRLAEDTLIRARMADDED